MIIGLSGYARSGKDTVADILVANHGFVKIAFADKLREALYALDPLVHPTKTNYFVRHKSPTTLAEVIDVYGWAGYKESIYGPEIRRLLQRLGTEAGRQVLGENIWVDAVFNNLPPGDVVISDCRYPNETKVVFGHGGVMWRINRPDIKPPNTHISETSLDNFNFDTYIENDGTLEQLENQVERYWRVYSDFEPIVGTK